MSSNYETGHAKNVANLQKLIEQVNVYPNYNPPVETLNVPKLQTLYSTAFSNLNEVEVKRTENKNAIHIRQTIFEPLKPLCTRIINLLNILNLNPGDLDQAKSLNKLIQGGQKKATGSVEEGSEAPKTVSTSRQSFTQQADNFGKLIQLITTLPNYTPNESELTLNSLIELQTNLLKSTQTVDQTEAALNNKFIERDQILYADGIGLYSIAQNVKKYVKSAYGATSPEYTKVSKITFTAPK